MDAPTADAPCPEWASCGLGLLPSTSISPIESPRGPCRPLILRPRPLGSLYRVLSIVRMSDGTRGICDARDSTSPPLLPPVGRFDLEPRTFLRANHRRMPPNTLGSCQHPLIAWVGWSRLSPCNFGARRVFTSTYSLHTIHSKCIHTTERIRCSV